jgi:hypothetical protein
MECRDRGVPRPPGAELVEITSPAMTNPLKDSWSTMNAGLWFSPKQKRT